MWDVGGVFVQGFPFNGTRRSSQFGIFLVLSLYWARINLLDVSLRAGGGRGNALPSPAVRDGGLRRRRVVSRRHGGADGLAIVSQLAGWPATHANA